MIDIAADLRQQADRYKAEAGAALEAAPVPLPDLETARAQILQQLADVDRRIAARQTAERRHAHLMDVAQQLNGLARRAAEATAPAPPADVLAAALRQEGERMPARPPRRPWTPDREKVGADGKKSTVITTKRACNGCGQLLGDVTEEEIVAGVEGRPLPDVRGECPNCSPGPDPMDAPLGEPVVGHAALATRPESLPEPPRERPFPAGEGVPAPVVAGGGDVRGVAAAHGPEGQEQDGGVTGEEQA